MEGEIDAVLAYWFGGWVDETPLDLQAPLFRRWFGKDEGTDREIRQRFEGLYERVSRGGEASWGDTAAGGLARILILDQFPRNMYRNTARAFATDPLALDQCRRSLAARHEETLPLAGCMFLYMPLMHAESRPCQEMSVERFARLADRAREVSPANAEFFRLSLEYAVKHKAIIDRFGRYPHRNEVLGRPSTPDETEFLKGPDSSF